MINVDPEHFAFSLKYRPKTIDELIATPEIKGMVNKIVAGGSIPNLLFAGHTGIGKTTIARLITSLLGMDVLFINASLQGNIDVLRNDILTFASSKSLYGDKKVVILDEADALNPLSTQPALRAFIEKYEKNVTFILTANHMNKIIEPLRGRCEIYDFVIAKDQYPMLLKDFVTRACQILDLENITYTKLVVAQLSMTLAPNWRAVLNKLQSYGRIHQTIDTGILSNVTSLESIEQLVPMMRKRNYTDIRKWVSISADQSDGQFFSDMVATFERFVDKGSIPDLVMIGSKYQYQAAFVVDQQLNICAGLAEVLGTCKFND